MVWRGAAHRAAPPSFLWCWQRWQSAGALSALPPGICDPELLTGPAECAGPGPAPAQRRLLAALSLCVTPPAPDTVPGLSRAARLPYSLQELPRVVGGVVGGLNKTTAAVLVTVQHTVKRLGVLPL